MDLSRIRPETVALAVAAALMLLVGTYTDNGGFQAAGVIVAVVATIVAFNQARSSGGADQEGSRLNGQRDE
jgi:hypothetical protein